MPQPELSTPPHMHPVDVRGGGAPALEHTLYRPGFGKPPPYPYLLMLLPASKLPRDAGLQTTMALDPSFKPTQDPFAHHVPLVVDHMAEHFAAIHGLNKSTPADLERWVTSLTPELQERLAIAYALQLSKRLLLAPHLDDRDPLFGTARDFLYRPFFLPSLPTAHRIIAGRVNVQGILDPERVMQLRATGWRDAAGRGIDAFLLGGALRAEFDRPPDLAHVPEPNRELAQLTDAYLSSERYALYTLLRSHGVILPALIRDRLQNEVSRPGYRPARLSEIDPDQAVTPADELLALDRANRIAAERSNPRGYTVPAPAAEYLDSRSAPSP